MELGSNMLGKLNPNIIERLHRVIRHPNNETWEDAHSIIINKYTTLWQAVLKVKPDFIRSKPVDEPWFPRPHDVISSETIVKAIRSELISNNINYN